MAALDGNLATQYLETLRAIDRLEAIAPLQALTLRQALKGYAAQYQAAKAKTALARERYQADTAAFNARYVDPLILRQLGISWP